MSWYSPGFEIRVPQGWVRNIGRDHLAPLIVGIYRQHHMEWLFLDPTENKKTGKRLIAWITGDDLAGFNDGLNLPSLQAALEQALQRMPTKDNFLTGYFHKPLNLGMGRR
jgi:hypothetical protein